jgi:hypothetical protein
MTTPFRFGHAGVRTTSTAKQANNQSKSIGAPLNIQGVAWRCEQFDRLHQAFDRLGWNFHYLNGESCIAVHRKWAISHICRDYRDARALLGRIGGAP